MTEKEMLKTSVEEFDRLRIICNPVIKILWARSTAAVVFAASAS